MPPYTPITLRNSLRSLTNEPWVWEARPGVGNAALTEQYKYYDRKKQFLSELFDYCWCVYEKALRAGGDQLIGRSQDLQPLKLKIAQIDTQQGQTLLQRATLGNILEMDKWSPVVNDCWILGGVHRRASFQLVSPRSFQNVWDASRNGLVVTAREMLGLSLFGYERVIEGGVVKFVSRSPVGAFTASIEKYSAEMTRQERRGPAAATELMGLRDDVAAQIRGFDRGRLRKVTSPR